MILDHPSEPRVITKSLEEGGSRVADAERGVT